MLYNPMPSCKASNYGIAGKTRTEPRHGALDGAGVYSRRGNLVGYSYSEDRVLVGSLANIQAHCMLVKHIVSERMGKEHGFRSIRNPDVFGTLPWVMIRIKPKALSTPRFFRLLLKSAAQMQGKGFRLRIAFDAKDLSFVDNLRDFRRLLFELSDHHVDVVLHNPDLDTLNSPAGLIVRRSATMISVTPPTLGIGHNSKGFDQCLYSAWAAELSSLIHKDGKIVMCEGVANEWQEALISSLPMRFMSYRRGERKQPV